ncbi:MAG: ABC transporter substrate-binding protein [Rhizobiales bacterium 24-66-13]|jgi:branched-chain amino acid transport system substrate-binding protein|nr:MAG: ABC transporter substrate-binding protein [Rhizobiales bacterium 35-66-30]OYZ82595.1 MAG: ABC transporter substrate-binding protein [Rhizobiales bacterium 24-66-13]OZB11595.1 MAG: ABC transporter substrate-binding protein [Rhizobiales bacterium 39-66-18]HQS46039.1 ABC transporter substrate-binding protein [Xanthobacteraceae bacterium]
MIRRQFLLSATAALVIAFPAFAADTVKVGLVLPMSGPFSQYGQQMQNGIKLFMKEHGDVVAGKKIELIVKDDGGIAPDRARRAVQDLIVRDKVDVLVGFTFTASALAAAPLAKEADKAMIVLNATSSGITAANPYMIRIGQTLPQITEPAGRYAGAQGYKTIYTVVADITAGHDAEAAFTRGLKAAGGEVAGTLRVPAQNPDFAPFVQRIKDGKPDAVFTWLPPGEATINFIKEFNQRGLSAENIVMLGTGDLTDELTIEQTGEAGIGVVTTGHYSMAHKSPKNQAFIKAYLAEFPNHKWPNFMSVSAYDGMAALYRGLEKTGGNASGPALVEALKGEKFESPRGPIEIDAKTRDIVQTVYVRKVERVDGTLANVEFQEFPASRDSASQ